MKTIYHVINNIDRGGAETLLLRLIPHLAEYRCEVIILEDHRYLGEEFSKAGIKVTLVDVLSLPFPLAVLKLVKFFKTTKPDIVHTHLLLGDRIGQTAAFLAGIRGRVSTLHNMEKPKTAAGKTAFAVVNMLAKRIIAVSQASLDFAVEHCGYSREKCTVVHNAPGFKKPEKMPDRTGSGIPLKIVQVARLQEQKGQGFLIGAVKILKDKGISTAVSIYGEGPQRDVLENQKAKEDLDNVFLPGTTDRVLEILCSSDLFISSSLWEGMPLTLVEAVSTGIPLIATDIPPHREILGDDYPYLVPAGSSEAIADAVDRFLKDDYRKLAEMSYSISKKFSIEKMASQYSEIYAQLK